MKLKLKPVKAISQNQIEIELKDLMIFFGSNNSGKTSVMS